MATSSSLHQLRLLGSSGSNRVMAGELSRLSTRALGRRPPDPRREGTGALLYPFDVDLATVAVRYHRTSARVLWDLFESRATRLEPLFADLVQQAADDARMWMFDGARISVQAFGVESFPAGERQVVGTVKNALIEAAARKGIALVLDPNAPDILFWARIPDQGRLVVSIDLAGRPMNQRGYRQVSGAAPLREDLAAQLVMLTRFDARTEALIDPMAGSGTLAIEAACMGRASELWQSDRIPLASRLPDFSKPFSQTAPPLFADTQPVIWCAEQSEDLCRAIRDNAERAGEAASLLVRRGDFRRYSADSVLSDLSRTHVRTDRGVILTNPPYGHRMDTGSSGLYRDFARWCRGFAGFRVGVIISNPDFEAQFGMRPAIKKPVRNGALRAYFLLYEV